MRPDPATGKLVPAVSGEELVELLAWPEAPPLELDDFAHVPSFDMHGELSLELGRRIATHARRDDLAGVVVTHGTDTMEETVYLVDRVLDSDLPVVFTGAQRGADQPDSDGPRNFRDAIRTAASADARGRGALIAFAGELHPAREARKVHTSALRAFASGGGPPGGGGGGRGPGGARGGSAPGGWGRAGPAGGGGVGSPRRPGRGPPLPMPERLGAVDLIRLHAGSDSRFLDAAVASG